MNEKTPQSEAQGVGHSNPTADQLPAAALARRRLLLKGAGGGAATLAALTPLGALATTQSTVFVCKNGSNKDVMCTMSGVQSAAHSFSPTITKVNAAGKNVAYWGTAKTAAATVPFTIPTSPSAAKTAPAPAPAPAAAPAPAPAPTPLNTWPTGCSPTALVSSVFGSGAEYAGTAMFTVTNVNYNQDMAHWITAYLNAKAMPASFPYTPAQVVNLYKDTTKRSAAIAFFKGYLENLA